MRGGYERGKEKDRLNELKTCPGGNLSGKEKKRKRNRSADDSEWRNFRKKPPKEGAI